jgi:integrase
LDAAEWRIPAERMKSDLMHTVPLTPAVVELLEAQKGHDDVFVFPGDAAGSHLSYGAMLELVKDMHTAAKKADGIGYVDPKQGNRRITPHGFRSSFKDWCRNSKGAYPDEVSELCLAHVNSDETRAAYARDELLPERAKLMQDWATFCTTKPAKGNVTNINKKSAA